MNAVAESYVRVRANLDAVAADPLRFWHFGVARLRDALRMIVEDGIDEMHLRACNKGTKTETLAAYVLACMQKRRELDGVPLPSWQGPVEAAQFVLDFKQQLLSVQPAYLRLLGKWSYHPRYNGETLTSLAVKPIGGSDNQRDWSVLHFISQENRKSGVGVRADIAAFDEPPVIEILREMRKAAHAGRRGIRVIAETPTIRRQWAPLKLEYGDCPRSSIRRISQDWAEARWSLDEVADWILSPADKAKLRRQYKKDPLRLAREHGDYFDASGLCPFDIDTLRQMLEACREPEVRPWKITREVDADSGRTRVITEAEVQVWRKPERGKGYYLNIDPSAGINDPLHDPGGIHVSEDGTGELCASYNGYIGTYGLGTLAAGLARQYNNAVVDPENNSGWVEGVLRGLADSHYGNIAVERKEQDVNGKWRPVFGFSTTFESRSAMFAAIQAWVDAWRVGIRYADCPSAEVIRCLLDIVLDEDGKPVAAPGFHDEHAILWGQKLRKAVTRGGMIAPDLYRKPPTIQDKIAAMIRAEDEPQEDGDGEPAGGFLRVKSDH